MQSIKVIIECKNVFGSFQKTAYTKDPEDPKRLLETIVPAKLLHRDIEALIGDKD